MKNLTLIILFLLGMGLTVATNATQWTVSNNPLFLAQFTSLQTAIDSAAAGDTLYVYHSTNHYGTSTINKALQLLGAGYHPSQKSSASFIIAADNVNISGFESSINVGATAAKVNNITLSNIYGSLNLVNVENGIIYNCFLPDIQTNTILAKSIIITNCFIRRLNGNNKADIVVQNNNFLYNSICYGSNRSVFGLYNFECISTKAITIENNIFVNGTPSMLEFCSINNNLTYLTTQNTLPYGNNTGTNNIANQDPKFVSNITYEVNELTIITKNYNYSLAEDSPAKNAGTDSTDIGITGGLFPWPKNANGGLDYTGAPRIPRIEYLQLRNTVVGSDGTLRFNVKGIKSK